MIAFKVFQISLEVFAVGVGTFQLEGEAFNLSGCVG
jgi:hypothetical protein